MKNIIFFLALICSINGYSQYSNFEIKYTGGADAIIDGNSDIVDFNLPNGTEIIALDAIVYKPNEYYSSGQNTQHVNNIDVYSTTGNIETSVGYDAYGNEYTSFSLVSKQTTDFILQQTYQAETEVDLGAGFYSSQAFPTNIVNEYTQATTNIQSSDPDIVSKAQSLTNGCTRMQDAVELIAQWVVGNLDYASSTAVNGLYPDDAKGNEHMNASEVFDRKTGNCAGYTNLMIALLRSVHIPARYVSGTLLYYPFNLPLPISSTNTYPWGESGPGTHAIYEVYYPDRGWVAADPQKTLNFNSTHFVRHNHGPDNCDKLTSMTYSYTGNTPTVTLSDMCGNITDFINYYRYDSYSTFQSSKSKKNLIGVAPGLATGIYDKVEITSGTNQFKTGEDVSYSAHFSSGDGSTYPINWYWEISLYYSGGSYVLTSETNGLSTWSTRTNPLIPSNDWLIDSNGRIFGEAIVIVGTNDGDFTSAKFPVGVDECSGILLENKTYTSNTTKQACYVTLNNVNVQNNAKLTIDSEMGVTIEKDFNVSTGSQLDIH